jgi:hypothetical protein
MEVQRLLPGSPTEIGLGADGRIGGGSDKHTERDGLKLFSVKESLTRWNLEVMYRRKLCPSWPRDAVEATS